MASAFYIKHGLSTSALNDLLALLRITMPREDLKNIFTSPYLFNKKFAHLKQEIKKVFLCKSCSKNLKTDKNGNPIENQPCGHRYKKHEKEFHDGCYTIILPVEEQVRYFIKHHGLSGRTHLASPDGMVGDVVSGELYKKNLRNGRICEHTITILICADGAKAHKRSKYGFWPFMGVINEAAYTIRRSNVILFGLFYGDQKPSMDLFIKPCVDELIRLGTTGVLVDGVKYYVKPLIISVDAVARPVLRNTTQFNGLFGCDFCLHPGKFNVKY